MSYNQKEAIKILLKKQKKQFKDLIDYLGLSRQGLDYKLNVSSLSLEDIDKLSAFFNIKKQDLLDLMSNNKESSKPVANELDQGDNYLMKYIKQLEVDNEMYRQTITFQQREIETLLGKSEVAPFEANFDPFFYDKRVQNGVQPVSVMS